MNITYYGHACFGMKVNGKNLLFDPFIKPNPLASNINIKNIPVDYILISHGHTDHIADAVEIAKQTKATVISNFEIINWLTGQGVENGHSMNIGGKHIFDFGLVKMVYAAHSSQLPDGDYGGNPGGFVIKSTEGNFYFAGDTGLSYDMKLIGDYANIDFAMLPIGGNFTMDVDNAIFAAEFIKCEKIIGMHYNTFPVISIDTKEANDKFHRAGIDLLLPGIGETISI
jgi:L-ascorbate metabolism protein UlaG (beta-lactamase superfamily)